MREMKDSGIDIVNTVPAEWNIRKLKYLCKFETGNPDTQDADPDGEYPFYVHSPIVERSVSILSTEKVFSWLVMEQEQEEYSTMSLESMQCIKEYIGCQNLRV